jgi:glyoxylase-like metal-dependent hydrolase (beta-lactamase superfamily II)
MHGGGSAVANSMRGKHIQILFEGRRTMAAETFRFKVGELDCLAVSDGTYALDASRLFTNAPQHQLREALQRHRLKPYEVRVSETCLVICTGQQMMLVDTGMGPDQSSTAGRLLQNLKAENIDSLDIDTVVLTHCHGDHIGGLTDAHGNLAFPKARNVMWKDGWDFCISQETRAEIHPDTAKFLDQKLSPIRDLIELLEEDREIATGIRAVAAPGHQPGHMMLEIASMGEKLLYISDTLLHPLNLEFPDWYAVYDRNPEQAVAERHELLRRAPAEGFMVHAFHFDFPGLGYIRREERAWQWEPVGGAA